MVEDVVVVERTELEHLRARARAWKRCASQYRRAFWLSRDFSDYWRKGYYRAWGLPDDEDRERRRMFVRGARPVMGAIYDFGRWLKRFFSGE